MVGKGGVGTLGNEQNTERRPLLESGDPRPGHRATLTGPGPAPSPQTWAPAYSPGRGQFVIPWTVRFAGEWQRAAMITGTPFM